MSIRGRFDSERPLLRPVGTIALFEGAAGTGMKRNLVVEHRVIACRTMRPAFNSNRFVIDGIISPARCVT